MPLVGAGSGVFELQLYQVGIMTVNGRHKQAEIASRARAAWPTLIGTATDERVPRLRVGMRARRRSRVA